MSWLKIEDKFIQKEGARKVTPGVFVFLVKLVLFLPMAVFLFQYKRMEF